MNTHDENFSHEDIAAIAHQIWEEEGEPEGKAGEHWKRALEHLTARKNTIKEDKASQEITQQVGW